MDSAEANTSAALTTAKRIASITTLATAAAAVEILTYAAAFIALNAGRLTDVTASTISPAAATFYDGISLARKVIESYT